MHYLSLALHFHDPHTAPSPSFSLFLVLVGGLVILDVLELLVVSLWLGSFVDLMGVFLGLVSFFLFLGDDPSLNDVLIGGGAIGLMLEGGAVGLMLDCGCWWCIDLGGDVSKLEPWLS